MVVMFEDWMVDLEGVEVGFVIVLGMVVVNGVLMLILKVGDYVVFVCVLFGLCFYILEDVLVWFGVEIILVDGCDLDVWKVVIKLNMCVLFCESVLNLMFEVVDFKVICDFVYENDVLVVVDNVMVILVNSYVVEVGVDLIIYLIMKYVDG